MTESSQAALDILRKTDNMQWYAVPLFVFVIYVYVNEIERENWSAVLLGIAFSAGEFIWEMFNAAILHFTDFAPLWGTPGGNSAYVIYAGLNIEIALFFAISGPILIKALPKDRALKILGLPNRFFVPVAFGLLAVVVETLLNQAGLLIWDFWWWCWPHVWLIVLVYCLYFLALAWCHDHLSLATKKKAAVLVPALALACHLIFANTLHWV